MKYILILITLFTINVQADTAGEFSSLIELELEYAKMKAISKIECENRSKEIKKMAIRRDKGEKFEEMADWVIDYAEAVEKEKHLHPKLTTEDVLYQITVVIWLYDNHKLSPNKIYDQQQAYCMKRSTQFLEHVYKTTKELLLEEEAEAEK